MEHALRWSSIASLCALVITLALQIAPNFVVRAEADPFEESTDADSEPVARRERWLEDDPKADEGAATQDGDKVAVREPEQYLILQVPKPEEIKSEENDAERFDRETEDLVERHEALQEGEAEVEVERYDAKREDLRERHEALMKRDGDNTPEKRFDTEEADLPERHEALRDEDGDEDEAAVKFYLVPVPQDESKQESKEE